MTREQAIKRATNKVLKDNSLVIVLHYDCIGSNANEYKTQDSDLCLPTSIIVNEVVCHTSNSENYWIQQKKTIQNGRFSDTIIFVE